MQGIFISYRREDSAGHAGRLFDRLRAHFGREMVFMDVEGIEAGVDFVETIEQAVGGCDVLLAVIGRGWLDCRDSQGNRRLDDPQDFIRLETAAALARKVRVIPVLVEGARLPEAESLPTELRALVRRQAVELRDSRWEDDVQALVGVLQRLLKHRGAPRNKDDDGRHDLVAWAWAGGAAALLLGIALIGYQWWPDGRDSATQPAIAEAVQDAATESEVPALSEPARPVAAAEKPATPKPAAPTPATRTVVVEKPAIAKPKVPVTAPVAVVQPAPALPTPAPAPAPAQPIAAIAPAAPVPAPAPLRTIAVVALGEPTFRDFWEGERRAPYSAKVAGLYRDILRETASGRVSLSINTDARDLRGLDKALRETAGLCDATRAGTVFVARVEETQAISHIDSAYWPELRLTAIACDSGKQYSARAGLSPRQDDGFPFERGMAETMEKFARENRRLLQ
jgi:hypothetical protein